MRKKWSFLRVSAGGLLVVAATLATPAPGAAGGVGVTCEECDVHIVNCAWVDANSTEVTLAVVNECAGEDDMHFIVIHSFLGGGGFENLSFGSCGGPDPGPECSACGGTSECHEEWDLGDCHLDCEGGEGFEALSSAVHSAVAIEDTDRIATFVADSDAVTLDASLGLVRVASACAAHPRNAEFRLTSEIAAAVGEVLESKGTLKAQDVVGTQ